ncbi:MAG: fibronectin-binding domain-containing protein [Candidatus Heimdallarchaeota archaeon]|nr:fibronectin-binding domain-containing protein [Candidatus Heimdallarchaeota archaeon]
MKTYLSSIDIAALVAEIRPKIIDSWTNNIYSIGKNLVILRFRKSTESPFELVIDLGKRFHTTQFFRKKPISPNNKVLSMRKHIRDLPIKDFYQIGLDRVVVFEIAYKDSFYKLIIELFGEGNIVLVGPNNKIILAYNYRRMKDRDVHPGRDYQYPPSSDKNILNLDESDALNAISNYEGKITNLLNELMGLGPVYSKDILAKSGVDKKLVEDMEEGEKQMLITEVKKLQDIVINKKFDYTKYLDEGEVVDITPIPLSRYEDLEQEKLSSFDLALDDFFSYSEEEPEYTEDKTEVSGKMSKTQKILASQEKHLEVLKDQERLEKQKGDLLYANFAVVDELLSTVLKARREDVPWEDIEAKLAIAKEKNIPSAQVLETITPKTKQIWVKLSDVENTMEEIVELDFTKTLTESANSFYEKAKKGRRKVPGAIAAIERTKNQLSEIESTKETIEKEIESKPMLIKRSKKWYEKFHWMLCDGFVVIGGTDAKVNERILKTYLDDNDLFFHADVHGAPYVVVKDGQNNLSEECKENIAVFALSYSSLWKDRKLVGDVYYVLPDQVSLTAPSGQFLAKGSVMIYGEKNYFKNVEIDHSIGFIIYDDYIQIIGGPTNVVDSRTEFYISIKPGDLQKGKAANEIKGKLLKLCPEEEKSKFDPITINEILPFIPGDSEIT